jgi:Tfp pilus assembly protein PilV
MKRQRMNDRGFTLIETTVAMLVMMVVGLGATSLFLYAVRYNSGASQRSIAMAVAQQRLEVLRGVEYDAAGLAFGVHAPETAVIAPTTNSTSGGSTYQVQKQVVPFPIGTSTATATQKQITIRVVPVNGNSNNAWANLNPVEVVFHRSLGAPGPYKQ